MLKINDTVILGYIFIISNYCRFHANQPQFLFQWLINSEGVSSLRKENNIKVFVNVKEIKKTQEYHIQEISLYHTLGLEMIGWSILQGMQDKIKSILVIMMNLTIIYDNTIPFPRN